MKSFLKVFMLIVCIAFLQFSAIGQASLSMRLSNRTIGLEDILQVEYAVKNANDVGRLQGINFAGWHQIGEPQTSQQTTIINGNMQQSLSYIYILKPTHKGRLVVSGASVMADGHRLSCAATTVQVTGGSVSGNQNSMPNVGGGAPSSLQSLLNQLDAEDNNNQSESGSNVLRPGETPDKKIRDNMFIKVTPSKTHCYVGEPILVTYELFSSLGGVSKMTKQPAFSGVGVVDLTQESQPATVTVNGRQYRSYLLRKVQLTPLQSGKIDLDYAETSNEVPLVSYNDPYHPQTYTAKIRNKTTFLEVSDLPLAGKPAVFSGAVGQFTITAKVDHPSIPAGENNNLHIEILGKGNLQGATLPQINWPAGVDHYDGTDSQQVDKSQFPTAMIKSFDIPFVGSKEGSVQIAPVSFTFFDPAKVKYETITSESSSVLFTKALPKKFFENNSGFTLSQFITRYLWIAVVLVLLIIIISIVVSTAKRKKKALLQKTNWGKNKPTDTHPAQEELVEKTPLVAENDRFKPQSSFATTIPEAKETAKTTTDFDTALTDISLETDNRQFLQLSKALLIQYLQEKLLSPSTNLQELMAQWNQASNDFNKEEVNALSRQMDKMLYSPFTSDNDRNILLATMRAAFRNG